MLRICNIDAIALIYCARSLHASFFFVTDRSMRRFSVSDRSMRRYSVSDCSMRRFSVEHQPGRFDVECLIYVFFTLSTGNPLLALRV